jgi:hypothetical protein
MGLRCLIVWANLVMRKRIVDLIKNVLMDTANVKTKIKFYQTADSMNAQKTVIAHQGKHVAIRNVNVKTGTRCLTA